MIDSVEQQDLRDLSDERVLPEHDPDPAAAGSRLILVPAFLTGAYIFNVGSSKYQPEVILSAAQLVVGAVFVIGVVAVTFFLRG